jgi:chromosome segregation ATPase
MADKETLSEKGKGKLLVGEQKIDSVSTTVPEIVIFYENNHQERLLLFEQYKKEFLSFLLEFQTFLLHSGSVYWDMEAYCRLTEKQIDEIKMYRSKLLQKQKEERWLNKVWNFLWGKSEEERNPEIWKKLDAIEEHLYFFSNKFKEVSESMKDTEERNKETQRYLEKMSTLHTELEKIEEYYEEELNALKTRITEYKQKEADLEKEVSLLNKHLSEKQEQDQEKREIEEQLESEIENLRKQIQLQSNKKNQLLEKMKEQSNTEKRKNQPENIVNPEYEKYGTMPMATESKKTMFDPNRYSRK